MSDQPSRTRRSRFGLYGLAFALLVGAVITLVISVIGFLESTGLLLASAFLSGLAIMSSVAGVLLRRRS